MGSIGRDELHLEMEDMGFHHERILVSVRMRPLNSKEIARNDAIDWECIDENTIIYRNSVSDQRSLYPNGYSFDKVFQWDSPTKQVYEEGAKKVALSVVSGINASIFAYGQTSSGKTYTMRGVTAYTVEDIYEYIHKHVEREFVLKFSAMEIYNEAVRDLLSADGTPLRLLDDPERGTVVDKLTEETLRDLDHLKELLSVCEAQRQIGETSLNEASSRSHQILRLTIESSAREFVGKDNSSTLAASVDFVDLAGSERASQALSAGTRLKEGCHINRSLLTLGTVIRKLSKGRNGHVPYRDSKLTRILQCSLGGNARTAIICTISPARSHVEQSRNTLTFASCAKEVATNAQVNIVVSDKALVKQLQKELARLASELRSTVPPSATDSAELLREKDLRIEKLEKEIKELIHQRDLAQSRLVELVHVGGDDQASEQWEEYDQPIRLRAPLTLSDDDLTSESSGLADRHCLDVGFTRINSSQYSNGFSESYSDEPYVHIPDTPVDQFLSNGISPQFSVSDTKFVGVDPEEAIRGEMITQRTDKNIEEVCKDVRCIEMEDSSTRIARSSSFMSHEFKRILPFTLTGNGAATYQALFLSAQKGDRGLEEVLRKYGIDQVSQFFPEKTDKELREHQTGYCIDQASSLSPQKGDKGLREVQTEYNVDHALPLSPEMREKGLRKVQSEYGINQLLPLSQEKGDKGLREVQTEYFMDKALPLFPREGDKELRKLQPEHVIDQELPLSPRDGDKEMTEVQTEYDVDHPLSSFPHPADKELCKVQTEYGPDEVLSLSQKGDKELGEVQTEHGAVQAFCLSQEKGEKESMESQQEYGFVESKVQDVQESSENMVNPLPEEPSSWSRTEDVPNSTSLKLARSRSCRANLMTSPVSPWFQNAEQNENTPSNEHEKDFPGRPKGIQRKFSALNFSPSSPRFSREDSLTSEKSASADEFKVHNIGNSSRYSRQGSLTTEQSASVNQVNAHITKNSSRYSRQDSFTYEQSASPYEVKVHNIETPSEKEITTVDTFVSELKEMTKLESGKKEKDDQVQEVEQNTNGSEKNVKDLALDLVENHVESHSNCTSEFEKQQREIIELWQVCNVSLVHRTYFFLLFKGDPTDSIYMEVERRRLSFIKDRISQANDNKLIVEGVPDLTQASSFKALRREREMLTKQMVKRLSELERVNLYKKWGIGLKTKQRKQQLARLLWSDTKDMNHVMESATLVARLVGLLEPGQAPKEMLGLSFTPQQLSRRSYSWKKGMSTFL